MDESTLDKLTSETNQLLQNRGEMTNKAYVKRQIQIYRIMKIYYSADELNAPIVIFNNIANTLVAASIPIALIDVTLPPPTLLGYVIPVPFAGTASFTFAISMFFLVLFGEVIPKYLGRNHPLAIVKYLTWFITTIDVSFGWLGHAFLSVLKPFGGEGT